MKLLVLALLVVVAGAIVVFVPSYTMFDIAKIGIVMLMLYRLLTAGNEVLTN